MRVSTTAQRAYSNSCQESLQAGDGPASMMRLFKERAVCDDSAVLRGHFAIHRMRNVVHRYRSADDLTIYRGVARPWVSTAAGMQTRLDVEARQIGAACPFLNTVQLP